MLIWSGAIHLWRPRSRGGTKVPIRGNMHWLQGIEVAAFKYEVRNGLWDYQHCLTLVYRAIALLFLSRSLLSSQTNLSFQNYHSAERTLRKNSAKTMTPDQNSRKQMRSASPTPLQTTMRWVRNSVKLEVWAGLINGKDSFSEYGTDLVWLPLHFSTNPNSAAIWWPNC